MHNDNKSISRWENLNIALSNYQKYLRRKPGIDLTYIDLLYISNFKGGNASIVDDEEEVDERLKAYTHHLRSIRQTFGSRTLNQLNEVEAEKLISQVMTLMELPKSGEAKIKGFKESYLSGLLHAHFPDLLPVLDRRVLGNAKLIANTDVNSVGQVKDIARFYPALIRKFHCELIESRKTLRDLDREYFIHELPDFLKKGRKSTKASNQ